MYGELLLGSRRAASQRVCSPSHQENELGWGLGPGPPAHDASLCQGSSSRPGDGRHQSPA